LRLEIKHIFAPSRLRAFALNVRDWFRASFFRMLKSLAWVAPLTILIWIYAERQQIDRAEGYQIPVELTTSSPDRLATLLDPPDHNVIATLTAQRARLNQAKAALAVESPLQLPVALAPNDEPYQLSTVELLEQHDLFKRYVVAPSDCRPAMLRIRVEPIIEREISLWAPAGLTNLEAPPVFDPPAIRLRGPASALSRIERADVEAAPFNITTPGVREFDARVIPPLTGKHVSVTPASVHVTVRIKQADVERKIDSMAVFKLTPSALEREYEVIYDPILPNVKVIGPPDKIELLQTNAFIPKAVFEVSVEDPKNRPITRRVRYELPPGVRVAPDDEGRTIEFRLVKRQPAE